MRRISFALTKQAFLDGSKTVTRRLGWKHLKPGDQLLAVSKCMGLKKGEKADVYGVIEVVSVRREPLWHVTDSDVEREGFQLMDRRAFVALFCTHMKCSRVTEVTRIEFRKLPVNP